MKVKIEKRNLQDVLEKVSVAVKTNTPLEIASMVQLRTKGSKYLIASVNSCGTAYGVAAEAAIKANILEEGEILIPYAFLQAFVSGIPDDTVTIENETGKIVTTRCRNRKVQHSLTKAEFPSFPSHGLEGAVKIRQFQLQDLIRCTQVAAESGPHDNVTNGIGFIADSQENTLRLTATNSRIFAAKTAQADSIGTDFSILLPKENVGKIPRLLSDKAEDTMMLVPLENGMVFTGGSWRIFIQKFSKEPLNKIGSLDTAPANAHLSFNRREALSTFDAAVSASGFMGAVVPVELHFGDILEVALLDSTMGFEDAIAINPANPEDPGDDLDIDVCFNPKLIRDVLKVMDSEEAEFKLLQPANIIQFKSAEHGYEYTVLPVARKD